GLPSAGRICSAIASTSAACSAVRASSGSDLGELAARAAWFREARTSSGSAVSHNVAKPTPEAARKARRDVGSWSTANPCFGELGDTAMAPPRTPVAPRRAAALGVVPVGDPPPGQVVGRQLHGDAVTRQDPDLEAFQPARRSGQYLVAVLQEHAVGRVRKNLGDLSIEYDRLLLRHDTSNEESGTSAWAPVPLWLDCSRPSPLSTRPVATQP